MLGGDDLSHASSSDSSLLAQLQAGEALHVAVARNSPELVQQLIATHHMEPNQKNAKGFTPLHLGMGNPVEGFMPSHQTC